MTLVQEGDQDREPRVCHIYFACGLHGPDHGPLPQETQELYDFLGRVLRSSGYSVYMPHEEPLPSMSSQQVYKYSETQVERADILLLYAGLPSLGNWY